MRITARFTIKKNYLGKAIKELDKKGLTYDIHWRESDQTYLIEIRG